MGLREDLIALLSTGDSANGVSESVLRQSFGGEYEKVLPVLNELLGIHRVQLAQQSNGDMWFKLIDADKASKLGGLTHEQILVYQEIEKAQNNAIWSGDIRKKLNMPTQSIDKSLKTLLTRGIIKLTRDVNRKNRKIYILSELEPAKEISGGPWYTDHEFDSEFVQVLSNSIVKFVRESGTAVTSGSIHDRVRKSGITTVNIAPEEFGLLLQTLVYDGRLEIVRSDNGEAFKVGKAITVPNYLTEAPCGLCPVSSHCSVDGVISPQACEYMTAWLAGESSSNELF